MRTISRGVARSLRRQAIKQADFGGSGCLPVWNRLVRIPFAFPAVPNPVHLHAHGPLHKVGIGHACLARFAGYDAGRLPRKSRLKAKAPRLGMPQRKKVMRDGFAGSEAFPRSLGSAADAGLPD